MRITISFIITLSFLLLCSAAEPDLYAHARPEGYTILSDYGSLETCDTMSRGIFVVWWNRENDLRDDVDRLLDTLMSIRQTCLTDFAFQDPPNPDRGYFYNVYLYNREDGIFPTKWGNGQGTDRFGNPYLTLPVGIQNSWRNTLHEGFHIFQYSANSPGFDYRGDSQWYIEATANWFGMIMNPNDNGSFETALALIRVPQVALWLSFNNYPASYPDNWNRKVRQYGLCVFLYYLSEVVGVPRDVISGGFYAGTNQLPQEYLYNQIGGDTLRRYFADWAVRSMNGFDYFNEGLQKMVERGVSIWPRVADTLDTHLFINSWDNAASNGWYRPVDSLLPAAWSFNSYRILNSSTDRYRFHIRGERLGSGGSLAHFEGRLLVLNKETGATIHEFELEENRSGHLTIDATPGDTAIYLVAASVPEVFRGVTETFGYLVKVEKGELSDVPDTFTSEEPIEIGRYDLLGRPTERGEKGLQFVRMSDGEVRKEIVL